ncbi:MAG: hypothetical protein EAZ08_03535 [Cytophagales bacterium]|nr:MAG: hypothetical protein EAZ08_03535 [Cytophagales bacterium]
MAYNQFKKLAQLSTDLGITDKTLKWLNTHFDSFQVSDKLLEDMEEASRESLMTEKAKSEFVVVPILRELRRRNANKFKIFSGYEFDVDKSKKLNGYCDFMLSANIEKLEVTAPIFCLVEAKNAEIDRGLAQCGAEMYAVHIFNEREGNPKKQIFGCVTNAFSWCFLKLENKNLYIDPNYVPLTFTKPHEVLAVLQWILDESLKPYQPFVPSGSQT